MSTKRISAENARKETLKVINEIISETYILLEGNGVFQLIEEATKEGKWKCVFRVPDQTETNLTVYNAIMALHQLGYKVSEVPTEVKWIDGVYKREATTLEISWA